MKTGVAWFCAQKRRIDRLVPQAGTDLVVCPSPNLDCLPTVCPGGRIPLTRGGHMGLPLPQGMGLRCTRIAPGGRDGNTHYLNGR